jgi:hypothetical protein
MKKILCFVAILFLVFVSMLPEVHASSAVWRGAGGNYLMADATCNIPTLLSYWQAYMPYMKTMGFNTFRLSFRFVPASQTSILLNYPKMDAVIQYLGDNGIKSILDNHPDWGQPEGNLADSTLQSYWETMATHYLNNPYVVAFEVCNEPYHNAIQTSQMNAQAYHDITTAIRQKDPSRTCIWQGPIGSYIPDFAEIQGLMLPNVVYSDHEWWTRDTKLTPGNLNATAQAIVDQYLLWESQYNIPIWLGEYGGPPGGNVVTYDPNDPTQSPGGLTYGIQWQICRQLTIDCNEKNIGWNLWCGGLFPATTLNRLAPYADMMATIPVIPPSPPFYLPLLLVGSVLFVGFFWIPE